MRRNREFYLQLLEHNYAPAYELRPVRNCKKFALAVGFAVMPYALSSGDSCNSLILCFHIRYIYKSILEVEDKFESSNITRFIHKTGYLYICLQVT